MGRDWYRILPLLQKSYAVLSINPQIISRSDHTVSRREISEQALKVLYSLHNAGYRALLVGGCVRDLLLGLHPKDFDVVTDARPEQVKALFRNCRLIGRRFRLAHILFGRDIIEVATFRGNDLTNINGRRNSASGRILADNVYGTLDEDVWRRDFTMNALYYDIADFSLIDYVGGLDDINNGVIRLIGEPAVRYQEDPVRMLRAIRFAAKLKFTLDPDVSERIKESAYLLADIPAARLFEEILKLFHGGAALTTFELLREFGLFQYLMPPTERHLQTEPYAFSLPFVRAVLRNTDARVAKNKSVAPAFLYAALLWLPLLRTLGYTPSADKRAIPNLLEIQKAASSVLRQQSSAVLVPRRFSCMMRDIWGLQWRLQRCRSLSKRALALFQHPRFRAAYDLLCLRADAGEPVTESAQWWTQAQEQALADGIVVPQPRVIGSHRRRRRSDSSSPDSSQETNTQSASH